MNVVGYHYEIEYRQIKAFLGLEKPSADNDADLAFRNDWNGLPPLLKPRASRLLPVD
jgi:hypothetical protein